MSQQTLPRWDSLRTDETRHVENKLRTAFDNADAYRYNSASIRVRVVDRRFEGLSQGDRDDLVEPLLETLPDATQANIMNLVMLAPSELEGVTSRSLPNLEFENPSPSIL